MRLTTELTSRDLTRTEQNILHAIANSKSGVTKKDLVQFTTERGLQNHLWAIRASLVNGYQIKRSNGRYKLVDVPSSEPLTTESPTAESVTDTSYTAAIRTKMAEERSVVESEIQSKIDAKRQLEFEISALQMDLAKIDNFIDVFDQYFAV